MNYHLFTNNELKSIADTLLRQYLLKNTPSKKGKYFCPIKKKYFPPTKMEVSHFIDRGVYHLRYDLDNVCLISKVSNSYDSKIILENSEYKSKHHAEYAEYLEEKGKLARLLHESKKLKVLTREDLIKVIKKLKDE